MEETITLSEARKRVNDVNKFHAAQSTELARLRREAKDARRLIAAMIWHANSEHIVRVSEIDLVLGDIDFSVTTDPRTRELIYAAHRH